MTQAQQDQPHGTDLADRYGTSRRAPRAVVVALVCLLVAAAAGWLMWVSVFHSRPEVTSQMIGFEVRSQHATRASYTVVRRDRDVRASCLLRALAADHAVVGELVVDIDSGPTDARLRSTVRTERRATTVDLVGCTTGDQTRRR